MKDELVEKKRKEMKKDEKGVVFVSEVERSLLGVSKRWRRRSIYAYIERTCLNVVSKLSRDNR